ncbi:unnamed protein product [Caretta caretta]
MFNTTTNRLSSVQTEKEEKQGAENQWQHSYQIQFNNSICRRRLKRWSPAPSSIARAGTRVWLVSARDAGRSALRTGLLVYMLLNEQLLRAVSLPLRANNP